MLKMADQGMSDFCVTFTVSLYALRLKNVDKLAISKHTAI